MYAWYISSIYTEEVPVRNPSLGWGALALDVEWRKWEEEGNTQRLRLEGILLMDLLITVGGRRAGGQEGRQRGITGG